MKNLKKALSERGIELVHVQVGKSAQSKLAKALETRLDDDELRKARVTKYLRREGTPGKYKYVYKEPTGKKKKESIKLAPGFKGGRPGIGLKHDDDFGPSYDTRKREGDYVDKEGRRYAGNMAENKRKEEKTSAMKMPAEFKKYCDKLNTGDKKELKQALANGWKPRNIKEYEKEAIEEEIDMYSSGDMDRDVAQDLMAAESDKLANMSDKEIEKEYKDEIGEPDEETNIEDMKQDLVQSIEDRQEIFEDEARVMSGQEIFEFYYDSKENFLEKNPEYVKDCIANDAFNFNSEHKEKKGVEKFHQKHPHVKGFLEHAGHSIKDYKPEQLKAMNEYIGKMKSISSKKK